VVVNLVVFKAFNTFVDDVFAFAIAMPMVHRIACLRDDVVFFIYLYQMVRSLCFCNNKHAYTGQTE
jgi:hypothetical protein